MANRQYFVRLQAKGHYGIPATPFAAWHLTAQDVDRYVRERSPEVQLTNIQSYAAKDGADDGVRQPAIGLTYRPTFAAGQNTKSVWTAEVISNAADYETLLNPFGNGVSGLGYTNHTANVAARWKSTFNIGKNRPWTIRLFLLKQASGQANHRMGVVWGTGSSRWRLEIVNGSLAVQRLADAWTDAQQNSLNALLDLANPTPLQQASIDTLRASIYKSNDSLSANLGSGEAYGIPFDVTFIPEPLGRMKVIVEGAGETVIQHDDLLNERQAGTMWEAGPVAIATNGGSFLWQFGFPQFARTGRIRRLIRWNYQTSIDEIGLVSNIQADTSLPGTSITYTLNPLDEAGINNELLLDFTSDGTYTPFLYCHEAYVPSGDRNGSSDVVFDSDDYLDIAGNPPTKDFSPECESGSLKSSYNVTLRNRNGLLNLPGVNQQALHDRMIDVYVNGDLVLKNGVVSKSTLKNCQVGTANLGAFQYCKYDSELQLTIRDMWQIMDEDIMLDDIVGDGLHLGNYLRRVLANGGVRNSEMTGISATAGRILPAAKLAEAWCVRPGEEISRGDYLRSLVEKYGQGWQLRIIDGIWTFAAPSELVKAAFSSAVNENVYRIIDGIDIIRDFGDTFNFFRVQGLDAKGAAILRTWSITQSWLTPLWRGFLGRIKRFRTLRDDSIRTADEADAVLRSLVKANGKLGRFFSFESYYQPFLFPGDFITVDGVLCQIARISTSSIAFNNDRSSIVAQEWLPVI